MVKRTRIGTASTLADTNVSNYVTTPRHYCPAEIPAPAPAPTNGFTPLVIDLNSGLDNAAFSEPVFSLASPERCDGLERIEEFLEQCFYCKRKLFVHKALFMYREHAFCTSACREFQIIVDEGKEKQTGKRKVLN